MLTIEGLLNDCCNHERLQWHSNLLFPSFRVLTTEIELKFWNITILLGGFFLDFWAFFVIWPYHIKIWNPCTVPMFAVRFFLWFTKVQLLSVSLHCCTVPRKNCILQNKVCNPTFFCDSQLYIVVQDSLRCELYTALWAK